MQNSVRYTLFFSLGFILFFILPDYSFADSTNVHTIIEQTNSGANSTSNISVHTNTGGNTIINGTPVQENSSNHTHIEINGKTYDYDNAGNVSVEDTNGNTNVHVDNEDTVVPSLTIQYTPMPTPDVDTQISAVQEKITEAKQKVTERKLAAKKEENKINSIINELIQFLKKII